MKHLRLAPEFARALLDAHAATPLGLHAWNGSDPTRRFDIHRNNVAVSLGAALATSFPVTRELVGDEFFAAMAGEYLRTAPPVSPVLSEYGDGFADFIETFQPAGRLPYLSDVARLERLRIVSYHAADAPALKPESLHALMRDPDTLARLRVPLHPACRVLRSAYPVASIWSAHQDASQYERDVALSNLDIDRGEDVLVIRPVHDVGVACLPAGAVEFLLALGTGQTLGDASAAASLVDGFNLEAVLAVLLRPGVATSPAGA